MTFDKVFLLYDKKCFEMSKEKIFKDHVFVYKYVCTYVYCIYVCMYDIVYTDIWVIWIDAQLS